MCSDWIKLLDNLNSCTNWRSWSFFICLIVTFILLVSTFSFFLLCLFLQFLFSLHTSSSSPCWFSTFPFLVPPSSFSPNVDPHLLFFSFSPHLFSTSYPPAFSSFPQSSVSPPSLSSSCPSVSCPTWLQNNSRIPAVPNGSCSFHNWAYPRRELPQISQSDEIVPLISNLVSLISAISQSALEMRQTTEEKTL